MMCRSRHAALLLGLAALLAACGDGGSSTTSGALPDGPRAPRAYTEAYLAAHPHAQLRLTHTAILRHASADDGEDTDGRGRDAVPYAITQPGTLRFSIDGHDTPIEELILVDASGKESLVTAGAVLITPVAAGRAVLSVVYKSSAAVAPEPRAIFVRPITRTDGTWELRAGTNCENCSFDNSVLQNQSFDGADFSGSTFRNTVIEDCTFRGAMMAGCDFSGDEEQPTTIRGSDFSGANLDMAHFDMAGVLESAFGGEGPLAGASLINATFGRIADGGIALWTDLGTVDFRNADLTGATFVTPFSGGSHFEGASLVNATFAVPSDAQTTPTCNQCTFGIEPVSGRVTSFAGAVLGAPGAVALQLSAGTDLSVVDFRGAQLTGGGFANLTFADADFTQADLSGATLDGSVFDGATFAGATLDSVSAQGASFVAADFAGTAMLPAAVLDAAMLDGANAYTANLQGVTLTNASLIGANLNYTDLSGAQLAGVRFGVPADSEGSAATLVGAYMPNVDLEGADLRGVDLSHAHVYGDAQQVNLASALLDGADFTGAICSGSAFTNASLTGAIFNQAQLVNTSFAGADLTRAIFGSAYLQGANFTGAASVDGARLDNAAVATMPGTWEFTEQGGQPIIYSYGATQLGAFATDDTVSCPDAEDGPCTVAKLNPVDNGPFPPVPTCVPAPPNYNNCTRPAPPPTPTPTP